MDLKDVKVLIGTPNYMNMFWSEVHTNHIECAVEWNSAGIDFNWMIIGRTFVHFARSQACEVAVEGGYTHIFWVDDDAIIDPSMLRRFIGHDKDIVIAPYPMRKAPHQIGVLSSETGDFHDYKSYRNWTTKDLNRGLVECDGGGTHAMLVKVSALTDIFGKPAQDSNLLTDHESMETEAGKSCPYFVMPKQGTEDMYFCYRMKCKGAKVWCDTDVFAPHVGFAPIIGRQHTETFEVRDAKNLEMQSLREGSTLRPESPENVSELRRNEVDSRKSTALI